MFGYYLLTLSIERRIMNLNHSVSPKYLVKHPTVLEWKKIFFKFGGYVSSAVVRKVYLPIRRISDPDYDKGWVMIVEYPNGYAVTLPVAEFVSDPRFVGYKESGMVHTMRSSGLGWGERVCPVHLVRVKHP